MNNINNNTNKNTNNTNNIEVKNMYKYPIITSIEQIKKAIEQSNKIQKDKGQWKLKEKEYSLTYCAYRQSVNTSFPDPETAETAEINEEYKILREIRGIVFDTVTGKIMSRPLHKFFNIGESEETKLSRIIEKQGGEKFVLLEKMDGQMIVPIIVSDNGKRMLRFCTKMGMGSFTAKCVEKYVYGENVNELDELDGCKEKNFVKFCEKWIIDGYTLVFEWCSPKTKIIIDYDCDKLIIIAIRNNITGSYIAYNEMKQIAEDNKIDYVKEIARYDILSDENINHIKEMKGVEGAILRFENDTMYKIKTNYYYQLHKNKQHIQWNALSEANIWLIIMENKLDDILPVLDLEETKQQLLDFSRKLWQKIDSKVEWLYTIIQEQSCIINNNLTKIQRKKEFVTYVNQEKINIYNRYDKTLLFSLFDETEKGIFDRDFFEKQVVHILSLLVKNNINSARDLLNDRLLKYTPTKIFFGQK